MLLESTRLLRDCPSGAAMNSDVGRFRDESDSLGSVKVPVEALYGAQTQRAIENFSISGVAMAPVLIDSLVRIKRAAALVNGQLGILEPLLSEAICAAATEIINGEHREQFRVDVYQTGSGTSTNMNVNEVLANRASELLGYARGSKYVHANDHVNLGQSSNDVMPSALHVAVMRALREELGPALARFQESLRRKASEFDGVVKLGRTHYQDAVPMRLGYEFGAFAHQIFLATRRIGRCEEGLCELALGATAVGTGLNAHPEFATRVIAEIARELSLPLKRAAHYFEALSARDAAVETSGQLRGLAVILLKMTNDMRLLASGPVAGFGEIELPALQPGSSAMPGKVNPVLLESTYMVAAQVVGMDAANAIAGQSGNLQLNVTVPLLAHNLLEAIRLLSNSLNQLALKCIDGIRANSAVCRSYAESSTGTATVLAAHIGYDAAGKLAFDAYVSGRSVAQLLSAQPAPGSQASEFSSAQREGLLRFLDVDTLSAAT
ncbi:MAG: fumarate hydratase (fumarase C),aerobic Class [Pseudomonadota bacterium]|jgi:fumarate hydratase class II